KTAPYRVRGTLFVSLTMEIIVMKNAHLQLLLFLESIAYLNCYKKDDTAIKQAGRLDWFYRTVCFCFIFSNQFSAISKYGKTFLAIRINSASSKFSFSLSNLNQSYSLF
ncbi:hypothetical protein, partial [Geobacillus stearothermophilus]|uniref:hypothetical protein n=1 Tax=Geobacillus stearothermophilus TaxID=1422 RepID=UPI002E210D4A|nr:hypothetical protein [Geobacillus stearothermophilus]